MARRRPFEQRWCADPHRLVFAASGATRHGCVFVAVDGLPPAAIAILPHWIDTVDAIYRELLFRTTGGGSCWPAPSACPATVLACPSRWTQAGQLEGDGLDGEWTMSGTGSGQRTDGVTIAEAARRLGLTIEAVRKRAQRGTLPAYKDDERWFIVLDGGDAVPDIVRDDSRDSRQDGVQDIAQDDRGPIEATYRVAGEGEPVALVPLDRMLAQVQGLAEELAALARRNEGLALERRSTTRVAGVSGTWKRRNRSHLTDHCGPYP